MANNQKLYVVSFGHSDKYLLKASQEEAQSKLSEIEQWLNKMLRHDFPEDSFAYFTTQHLKLDAPFSDAKGVCAPVNTNLGKDSTHQ